MRRLFSEDRKAAGSPRPAHRRSRGVGAVIVLAIASAFLLSRPATGVAVPGMRLAGVADFTLSGTVSGLVPGVPSNLTVTVGNSYNVPITVTSLTVSVSSDPANCGADTYLSFDSTKFTGAPPSVTVSGLSQVVPANGSLGITRQLLLDAGAPNATCQNVTYSFDYTGTATYTANSVSVVTSSANPSTSGSSVTLTATVTGDPNTATPAGSVVFFECTVPAALPAGSPASACTTSVALSGTVTLSGAGVATFSTSSLPVGSHSIFATYTPTAGSTDFNGSSSVVFVQQVTSGGGGGGGGGGGTTSTTSTSTTTTTVPPAGPTVTVTKANNAAGTGFGPSEVAAAGATSVPFRVVVTNPNSSPGVVSSLSDTVGSTTTSICPVLIGTLVAPGASVTCSFTGPVPAATTTDTAVAALNVNSVLATSTASSTVFPPVKGVVVTPTTTPGVPPTTVPTKPGKGGGAVAPTGPLAFTGAHVAGMVLGGAALVLAGALLTGVSRRRTTEEVAP